MRDPVLFFPKKTHTIVRVQCTEFDAQRVGSPSGSDPGRLGTSKLNICSTALRDSTTWPIPNEGFGRRSRRKSFGVFIIGWGMVRSKVQRQVRFRVKLKIAMERMCVAIHNARNELQRRIGEGGTVRHL